MTNTLAIAAEAYPTDAAPMLAAGTVESILASAGAFAETLQATIGDLEGKPKNDVAAALANILNAVADRIRS
jgi:hypothetical protein